MSRLPGMRAGWGLPLVGLPAIVLLGGSVFAASAGSAVEGAAQVGTVASANCPDDALEQNDSQGAARAISMPTFGADLRVCSGDDDFYSFQLSTSQQIQIHAFFDDAQGDINIGLRDPGGNTVVTSLSENDNEGIVYTASSSGMHYLQVNLFSDTGNALGNSYDLQVNLTGTCADDVFEQNDTRQSAQAAGPPFYQPNLRACPGDMDWFTMPLFGGSVQVDAFFTHAEGNINISLYDAQGSFLAASTSFTDDEKFVYQVPETGTYSVLVFLETPQDVGLGVGNTYDLQVSQPNGFFPCPDDALEDTDSPSTGLQVMLPYLKTNLRLCPGDHDFFLVPLSAGQMVRISAQFDHAEGDLDLWLYAPINPPPGPNSPPMILDEVASSESDSDDESIVYSAKSSGLHYLKISLGFFGDDDSGTAPGNTYDLQITGPKAATATPSATPTSTPTRTPTPTQQAIATATPTRTPTRTPTSQPQATATNTSAPQSTPTNTSPAQATATPTRTPTRTATPGTGGLPGDANCDGTVNSIDAAVVLQTSAGLLAAPPCPENADVNNDGGINSLDAALILQQVAGLI